MSGARERQTLVRLSVVAGSAATFAAAWLGILPVGTREQPSVEPALTERLPTGTASALPAAASSVAATQQQTAGTPTAQVPVPAAGAGASVASQAAMSPAPPPQQTATASSGTTVIVPTTPAPVQRVITRRSRAS